MSKSVGRREVLFGLAAGTLAAGGSARAQEAKPGGTTPAKDPTQGLITSVTRQANLEGRVLWMDATANLQRLSTREGVAAVFDRCRSANINTVVVDVKPLSGHVLWPSKIAPRLKEWRGVAVPENHDLLFTAMLEGRRRGIKVFASLNTFSKGHKLVKSGPLYDDPRGQAIVYDVQRTVTAADGAARDLQGGENNGPADGQLASYDGGYPSEKKLGTQDTAAVVVGDTVTALVDGSLAELGGIRPPKDGHLLVGRGEAARWLLEHLQVGQKLTYAARPLLQGILDSPSEPVGMFVNPADPAERQYMLRLVEELAESYALDGIVFDRMRFAGMRTDFSPLSQQLFEAWLGKKLERFPEDIYAYSPVPGGPRVRGPYFREWLEWRATVIRDFLDEARKAAESRRPGITLGAYVGSWYEDYFGVGVNWGADDFHAGYDWMTPAYAKTGYAGKLHWLTTGCYHPIATREDARQLGEDPERTVQAAAETSMRAVNEATFVYAGIQLLDYQGQPELFRKALQTAVEYSQGVMLFDLVYLENYGWWNILSEVFPTVKRAPHEVPGLRETVARTRAVLRATAQKPAGSPTGPDMDEKR